jgi:AcrR family transcriptional regulator
MGARAKSPPGRPASARERIDHAAYQLFSRHSIRTVGVDAVAAHAGVAKMTLYKHYPSKDELALAFLRRREELWTRSWLQAEVERRGATPGARLLAIFDLLETWCRRPDYEGCAFTKALLEHADPRHPVRVAVRSHIATIRSFLVELAKAAGARDPARFAQQWQVLMIGCLIAAYAGEADAVRNARELGRLLLQSEGLRAARARR